MRTFTLEQLTAKGIAERPTEKSIITNDGNLYILLKDGSWVETGAIAMDIANKNI